MKSIRRVLIVQPYGLGDALFMTPVLRALRTLPTVETVDLLLGSRTEEVFRNNPHVDQIFSVNKGKWHVQGKGRVAKEAFSLWQNLRGRYDLLIDFSLQREYGFYGQYFLSIPERIGFDFNRRGTFLTKRLSLPNGYEAKHVAAYYTELLKLIGLEIDSPFLEFYLSKEDRQKAGEILQRKSISPSSRFVVVAPGGGESWGKDAGFKRWPGRFFAQSLQFLKARMDYEGVLILGSKAEEALAKELEENSPVPIVNLCGQTSLAQSAAILEKSLLLLANDGGLVHLAHALGVPLVALYGPVDPKVYGPFPVRETAVPIERKGLPCRPCYFRFRYNSSCPDRECLENLSPEEVFSTLDRKNFWASLCPA